jgi:hypothetical protein
MGGPLQCRLPRSSISDITWTIDLSPVRSTMASSLPTRVKHSAAVAFLTLLAIGAFAPLQVQAGCGHKVTSSASRSIQESLAHLELFGYAAAQPGSLPPLNSGDRPCNGVFCSRGRNLPLAPAPSVTLTAEIWCCLSTATACRGRDRADRLDPSAPPQARYETSPPERPPRPTWLFSQF